MWDEVTDGPIPHSSSSLPFRPAAVRPVSLSLLGFPRPIHTQLPLHADHQPDNLGVAIGIISLLTLPAFTGFRSGVRSPKARSRLECARLSGPEGFLGEGEA